MNIVSKLLDSGYTLDSKKETDFPNEIRYIKPAEIEGLGNLYLRDVFLFKNGVLCEYMLEFSHDGGKYWNHNYFAYLRGKDPMGKRHEGFDESDLLEFPFWLHTALEHLVSGKLKPRDLYILMLSIYDETTDVQAKALYQNQKFMAILTAVANFFVAQGLNPRVYGFWNWHWTYVNYITSFEGKTVHITLRWLNPIGQALQIVYGKHIAEPDELKRLPPERQKEILLRPKRIDLYERIVDCSKVDDLQALLRELVSDLQRSNWIHLPIVEVDLLRGQPVKHFLDL